MKRLATVLLVALLCSCAAGQGTRRSVVFNTRPQGAKIYLQINSTSKEGEYLGHSGAPIRLDLRRFEGQSGFSVTFHLPGYEVKKERIPLFYFEKSTAYPEKGAVRLDPTFPVAVDLYYFIKAHSIPVLALLVLALLFVWRVVIPRRASTRRALARAAMWEEIARNARPDEPMLGKCYGRYRIIDRIGAGGMGTVYRAVPSDTLGTEDAVAVKIINADAAGQPGFIARFRREARIMAELSHPNILRVLDY
jgi:hypothetical protein